MESLREIASRHGTDKAQPERVLIPIYERLLEHRRKEPVRVLEIGILEGAGLRMWLDYFPQATVVGLDLVNNAKGLPDDRVTVIVGSQADGDMLSRTAELGPFDIVVDDGSHMGAHQRISLEGLWSALNPGGVYFVEDIHTSYLGRWYGGYRREGTFIEYAKTLVDEPNQRWHQQPAVLVDLESIQVYPELCVLTKLSEPFYGGRPPDPDKLAELNQPPG